MCVGMNAEHVVVHNADAEHSPPLTACDMQLRRPLLTSNRRHDRAEGRVNGQNVCHSHHLPLDTIMCPTLCLNPSI